MRYLATGGCGFIGSHLVDSLLADGHDVLVLDDLSTGKRENLAAANSAANSAALSGGAGNLRLVVGDVADADLVARLMAECDGAFHLAAVASVQRGNEAWAATHRVNMGGTVAVYEAAAKAARADGRKRPVAAASSAAIYGDGGAGALREDRPAKPLSAYGADKYGLELQAAVAAGVHGTPVRAMRFFNVFGTRQDPASPYSGVLSLFARRIAEDRPISIHGDGRQTRDFIHVSDVARACRAAMTQMERALEEARPAEARAYNVCRGVGVSVLEAAEIMARLAGRELRLEFGPARAGDIRHSLGDPSRLAEELGVRAQADFAESLAALTAPFAIGPQLQGAEAARAPGDSPAANLRAAG